MMKKNTQNICLRVLTILCMLMASVGAWAADYVISYTANGTTYYLANNGTNLARVTTFDPTTCIWNASNTLATNQSRTISKVINGTTYYLNGTTTSGGNLALGNTQGNFRLNNNYLWYRNGTSNTTYFVYYNNGWKCSNDNRTYGTTRVIPYAVETTDHAATGGITITANPTTINDVNGTSNLQTNFTNYTQHYVTYNFSNNDHNWYGNADHGNTAPTPLYSLDGSTYNWTMTNAGTNATLNPYGAYSAGLTYSTASATDRVVTVKLTASNVTYDFNQEATANVTLKAVNAPQFVGLYNIVSNRNTAYYVTVSPDNFYNGNAATPNLIDIQQPDIWALYSYNGGYYLQHASDGKWAVSNRNGNGDYAVHIQEYANPVNNATLWNISDLNAATQTIQPSTNAALFWNAYGNVGNSVGYYSNDDGSKWRFLQVNSISAPTIAIANGGQVTLSHEMRSATIYYTTDGSTPTTSSTRYTGQFNVANGTTVKAIAVLGTLTSAAAERIYRVYATPVAITSLDQITDPYGAYILTADVNASGSTTIANFYGSFDGDYHVITGLDHPIFGTLNGAEVKNVIVDNVSITGETVGAIASVADNGSRIYNCGVLATGTDFSDVFDKPYTSSSTISGNSTNGAVGSIVGRLRGNSRVANCYSYADITSGRFVGGIVGDWEGTWYNGNGATGNMVANCMFYGNLTGGSRSPIVNSNATAIGNDYSLYSYFRYKSMTTTTFTRQNGALAAQEDIWLKRFKFFQAAVTNHRDMAAYYIFGEGNAENTAKIAQWYIDESIAPWPILRKVGARKSTLDRVIPNTGYANEGNLIINGKILLNRNDGTTADPDVTKRYNMNVGTSGMLHVNFNVSGTGVASGGQTYSVDLPITDMDHEHFDYTWGKVVLPFANEFDGWTPDYDYICTGWEISSVDATGKNGFTDYNFADRDCTAKDIYDAANNPIIFAQGGNWIVPYGVTSVNIKAHFARAYYLADATYDRAAGGGNTHGGNRPNTYHGKTVYTSAAGAWGAMSAQTLPHSQALVLVGNYHYNANTSGNHTGKGCTIMSVDEDKDQQPDYGWYTSVGDYRQNWMPMRWDFIPMIGAGMAQIYNSMPPGIAIPVAKGWLEMTETSLCRTFEFEVSDGLRTNEDDGHSNNAYIINGGWFQQIVRCFTNTTNNTRHSYMKIGGNAFVQEYFHGNHSGANSKYTLRPMNLTGGEVVKCFMTGLKYSGTDFILANNNGQNMRFYCAGGKIDKYISCYMERPVQDATMKVDHAYINRFFGGGTTSKAEVQGNIDITMDNSYVNFFCGGPEFGDMNVGANKTVKVSTTGSIFGEYYGAGFGGTELTRISNGDGKNDHYDTQRLSYDAGNGGFEVSYEMEALLNGSGAALFRYYDYRAALSMATAGATTTEANKCLFLNSFYGGGCQGKVDGAIISTLNDCDVKASAFGGGYKAAATTIDVYPTGGYAWQGWDGTYKAFSDPTYPNPVQFKWAAGTAGTSNEGDKLLYTSADMSQMGRVTGDITITVNGGTVGQNVYGGGNESPSDDAATVLIKGGAQVGQDAFGGGNIAPVGKAVSITLGEAGVADASNVAGAIYGGGALADTNTTSGNTTVNLYGGFVTDVYGGGLGRLASGTEGQPGYLEAVEAIVNGNTTVTLDGSVVRGNIFGCNNLNGTPKGHAFVDIKTTKPKGTETQEHPYHVLGVYGGGNLAAYEPKNTNDKTEVLIEKCDNSIEDVFGGGNAAAVPETDVTVWGGQIGRVFAGGNGSSAPADVTRDTKVTIHGGTIKEVYGGSNSQGAIGGTITVDVAELKKPENPALCPINVTDLYGGGNMADSKAGQISIGKCTNINNVYGGANKANVTGDITLAITDGHIGNVFGGNNNSGQVNGNITVNVNWVDEGADASLGNVYGGGNLASIDNGTPREVTVNIIDATTTGSIFGAGKGKSAVLVGNTTVNIGSWTEGSVHIAGDVFGGGDLAAVEGNCTVTIRDCDTYIGKDLYGGGNAAPVYETNTTVWGGTIAGNLFGGGNGVDTSAETGNPNGAQVGYDRNDVVAVSASGDANTYLYGGTVGTWSADGKTCTAGTGGVFGGSNSNGNIHGEINLNIDERACDETDPVTQCDMKLREIYGAGNEAAYAGEGIAFNLGCVSYLGEIYGGAKAADLNCDAILTITSGTFGKVFGGNNVSGKLNGKIVVTIEETGCHPVVIDELYGGGNLAAYSVYGYSADGAPLTSGASPKADPVVNIVSCTHIGKVFGGGLGATAVMVGNPTVSIQEVMSTTDDFAKRHYKENTQTVVLEEDDQLGSIGVVFGGGNEAKVIGNTFVNVATGKDALGNTLYETDGTTPLTVGAYITGNVYGGGNQADVTGKTNVTVGR